MRKKHILYALLFLYFIVKQVWYVFLIPPWEGPDETEHVSYVKYLVQQRSFPSRLHPFTSVSIIRSFDYLRGVRKKQNALSWGDIPSELFDRRDISYSPVVSNLASHPPLYYLFLIPIYLGSFVFPSYWTLIFLRSSTLMLSISCLFLVYRLTQRVCKNQKMALLVTVLVSLQPMYSFISSIVNSDMLVVFFSLCLLHRCLTIVTKARYMTGKDMVIEGCILGLSTLVKPQLLVGYVIYGMAIILRRRIEYFFFLSLLIGLCITGTWYMRQYMIEGPSALHYAVQQVQSVHMPIWRYPIEFISGKQYVGIFMSFWGFFGWLDVPMPKPTYIIFLFFLVVGFGGLWYDRGRIICIANDMQKRNELCILSLFFVCYTASIVFFDLQVFTYAHHFVIHGRYLAPILPLLMISLVRGVIGWGREWENILFSCIVMLFVYVQMVMGEALYRAYY